MGQNFDDYPDFFVLNSAGHLLHKTDPELRYFGSYAILK
jgi:hypothetical protein